MKKEVKSVSKKNKRILMLNYEFPPLGGGASPVSYEIAKGYVKLGHKVSVVTMHYKGLPEYEEKEGIKTYRVKCLRSKKELCHPWEQYTYLRSAKKFLKSHLKNPNNKYDIVHCHFIIPTGVLALWLKQNYNLPYIITSHGSDVLGYNKRFKYLYPFLKSPWKKIIKEAKTVITPSKFLQNKIKEITTEGNFQVIPNGIDKSKFSPMKKEKRILVVARLFENKGVQDVLDALKGIDLESVGGGGWKVDIVGDGPYRPYLEAKSKDNHLNNSVVFHGWVDNSSQKMKELYGKASIFVSASWFESFGLTLIEALSAGCYPLASDIGGHKEVLNNQGTLFKLGNSEDLRDKMKELIKMRIKSPNKPEEYYWDNIIKEYGVLVR